MLNLSNVSQNIMIQASIQGAKRNIKGYEIIFKDHLKNKPIKLSNEIKSTLGKKTKTITTRYRRR